MQKTNNFKSQQLVFQFDYCGKKFKHDFKIVNGVVMFQFKGCVYKLRGFEFLKFLKENLIDCYFENIQYHTKAYTIIHDLKSNSFTYGKLKGDSNWKYLKSWPIGVVPVIKNVKPLIDNPFKKAEIEYEKNY